MKNVKKSTIFIGFSLLVSCFHQISFASTLESVEKSKESEEDSNKILNENQKEFDMFGLKTSILYQGEVSISGKQCRIKGVGEEQCTRSFGTMIGNSPVDALVVVFEDGQLSVMTGASPVKNFHAISSSFEGKYGKPYKVENTEWQNKLGNKLDNIHMTWKFSDGVLILKARDFRADYSGFVFVSQKKLDKPKIDAPINF